MEIRKATRKDTAAICRVHRASITRICSSHYAPEHIEVWAGARQPQDYENAVENAAFYVAEEAGEVVGLSFLDRDSGEVHAVYVHPDFVRRGVGTALLAALEEEARLCDLSTITLNATLNSVSFYKVRGFSSLGETTNTLPSGVDVPCLRMEKRL